jgi:oligosaccharide repeat unit polymerase
MAETSLPGVTTSLRHEPMRAAPARVAFSLPALMVLGIATVALLMLGWFVPSPRLWSPAVSGVLACGFFAFHLICARRYLNAFDPGIWIAVNMLLNYFGLVAAVEILAGGQMLYDPFNLGVLPRLNQSFVVALLTLVAFMFGMHLAGWLPATGPPRAWPAGARSIAAPGWAMLLLGSAMILVGIPIAGPSLLFGSYGDMKVAQKFATADLRFFGTGLIILQCGIFALIADHDRRRPWRLRAALITAVALSVLRIFIGDRTGLMTVALAGGWAFALRVRQVPHWVTAVAFAAAFVVMPVIGEYREFRSVSESASLGIADLAAANFKNMGSSIVAFSYTLEHIPDDKGYDWGMSIVAQVIDNIPNLGLAPGRYFGLDALEHNPSKWLVATANPSKWRNFAGGYGYAVGAEWYFNFGMPGVCFGMALLGWITGRVRNASTRSPLWLTFSALLSITSVSLVRNDFGYPLRQILWPFVTFLIFRAMLPAPRVTPASGAAAPPLRTGSR